MIGSEAVPMCQRSEMTPDSFANMDMSCRCTPELQAEYAAKAGTINMVVHRTPIDCWTVEDEDRKNRSVYVVAWVGDEDCGARNDGPVAVFRSYKPAMAFALAEAIKEADEQGEVVNPGGTDAYGVGRGDIRVRHFLLPEEAS